MIYGILGAPIPVVDPPLPYAGIIQTVCEQKSFPPCFAYAVAWGETIGGQVSGWLSLTYGQKITAATVISPDQGHGIFQLTSSWPLGWDDPFTNTCYAVAHFLRPALDYFAGKGHGGDALVDIVADAFNEGSGTVDSFLTRGVSPDRGTTGGDYGKNVVTRMHLLLDGRSPA